jgi:hypothetical protein
MNISIRIDTLEHEHYLNVNVDYTYHLNVNVDYTYHAQVLTHLLS